MRDPDFRFKQFSIWHDQCAMKVNTDGILLGAWTNINSAKQILDIGTGTGLIALILAQKSATDKSTVVAVEIDDAAAQQARFNFAQSNWQQQLTLKQQDIQTFSQLHSDKYDLIVSNPPYFTNSLQAPGKERNLARHNNGLSFEDLLASAYALSTEQAEFNLILPCNEAERLLKLSHKHNWHLKRQCLVSTVAGKQPSRTLLNLSRQPAKSTDYSELTIRNKDNRYSTDFVKLCKDFYLFM